MTQTPTVLPFRFYSFERKNIFLEIVQVKGFEVISENQTVLSSVTTGKHSSGILDTDSHSVKTKTQNIVAYDISIKKVLDDQDKQYIHLLAEYFNFNPKPTPGFIKTVIAVYILVFLVIYVMEALIPKVMSILPLDFFKILFFASGPVGYYYFWKRVNDSNDKVNQDYQLRLKSYIEPTKSK